MNATPSFEEFQKLSQQQMDTVNTFASTLTKGLQDIAAESTEYSKKAFAANTAAVEKLLGAKSVESAIEIQTAFAKSAYEDLIAETTKLNELYTKLAAEALKPVQTAFASFQPK